LEVRHGREVALPRPWKPTKEQLAAAYGKKVADVISPNLKVLFCGINPSLYSAAVRHHFARPGNRFWPTLHAAGFTQRLLSPFEERELLRNGLGITNLVDRATASANELSTEELMAGAYRLERKIRRYRPAFIAFVGITAYRTAFSRPQASLGRQPEKISNSCIWILPNPSGLNAHFQLRGFARLFAQLRRAVESGE
jgi:TDG/mug DNA glycosylase family protein